MRKLLFKSEESAAYAMLIAGFILLVVLLRTDLGTALFDKERLFYKVPLTIPKPELHLELDSTGGSHMLWLHTENFVFANMCKTPKAGESIVGHAHLYINGRKTGSLYEPHVYLPELSELPPGNHKLTVSLNILPDHRSITVNGVPVSADIDFFVAETDG